MVSLSDGGGGGGGGENGEEVESRGVDAIDVQVPKTSTPVLIRPEIDEDVPLVIDVAPENETRDASDSASKDNKGEERESPSATATSDMKKLSRKSKSRKSSKIKSKAERVIGTSEFFSDLMSTLDKNITAAKHDRGKLTDSTLINPFFDGLIDNMIDRCDPLNEYETSNADTHAKLLSFEKGNLAPTYATKVDDQLKSKIDRILAMADSLEMKDDAHYGKFDLNGVSAFVNQKREINDLVVSKGLVDAELQLKKEELSNAINGMKVLKDRNEELNDKVQSLKAKLKKMKEDTEYAVQKEKETSQSYKNDLDSSHCKIEHMKQERKTEEAHHWNQMSDLQFALEEEIQNKEQLTNECLLLKQQLVAERKKRLSLEEQIHAKDIQNEELLSKLHHIEDYCIELKQTMKKNTLGMKKEHKELQKINENLSLKMLSSKEKLKRSRRERNEILFRLERLSNCLRVDANTRMHFKNEEVLFTDLEDIDDELFLNRQNRRSERMQSIMEKHE
jgi:hypothetical protein